MEVLCEKVADKLFEKYRKELTGPPGANGREGPKGDAGIPGMNGPEGKKGKDGWDPYRIAFNEDCAEFKWKGISFIIPFSQDKYPDVSPGELTRDDLSFIRTVHPELFEKITIFWYRDYQYLKGKSVIFNQGDDA